MMYKIEKENRYGIKFLNYSFVKYNKGKCKLIINQKECGICDYIEYDKFEKYGISKDDDLLALILQKKK